MNKTSPEKGKKRFEKWRKYGILDESTSRNGLAHVCGLAHNRAFDAQMAFKKAV
jgi:hypothetical protein